MSELIPTDKKGILAMPYIFAHPLQTDTIFQSKF